MACVIEDRQYYTGSRSFGREHYINQSTLLLTSQTFPDAFVYTRIYCARTSVASLKYGICHHMITIIPCIQCFSWLLSYCIYWATAVITSCLFFSKQRTLQANTTLRGSACGLLTVESMQYAFNAATHYATCIAKQIGEDLSRQGFQRQVTCKARVPVFYALAMVTPPCISYAYSYRQWCTHTITRIISILAFTFTKRGKIFCGTVQHRYITNQNITARF